MSYQVWISPGVLLSEHRTMDRALKAHEKEVSKKRHHFESHAEPDDRVVQGACSKEGWPDNVAHCELVVLYSPYQAFDDVVAEAHVYIVAEDVH